MVTHLPTEKIAPVIYPESDGKPMSDNTKQFRWIVTIKENLELLLASDPNVFVAGDLLWYPVEGSNSICQAPDVMVVLGRPKGDRGSYQQWQEADIPPQVVFEILSPSNRMGEMRRKLQFYEEYGVEEYYLYDPERIDFDGWTRIDGQLQSIEFSTTYTSPCLNIRFELQPQDLVIYRSDGQPFLGFLELDQLRQQAEQRAEQAEQRAEQAEQKTAKLAAKLQELGIDPSSL
jgi:Uma2 family endonuclease